MKTLDPYDNTDYGGQLCSWAEAPAYKYKTTVPTTVQTINGYAKTWLETFELMVSRFDSNWNARNNYYVIPEILTACEN